MKNDLHVDYNAPLNAKDTEFQTYGCRQNNPDICSNNSIQNVCAFTSEDCICKRPSRAWKKQYTKLLEQSKNKEVIVYADK